MLRDGRNSQIDGNIGNIRFLPFKKKLMLDLSRISCQTFIIKRQILRYKINLLYISGLSYFQRTDKVAFTDFQYIDIYIYIIINWHCLSVCVSLTICLMVLIVIWVILMKVKDAKFFCPSVRPSVRELILKSVTKVIFSKKL